MFQVWIIAVSSRQVRKGVFTQASEVLGVSQPALTARLRTIEENLSVCLFWRGRHGALVTPADEAFIDAAR
ncbi:LysR family transcriptional regulator [Aestuariibius insulae]|uniref:LysR family transcriptional regulator n=1 Tax=Aestuariibius insulae TaxID=2058287 RepID=UPI00345EDD75